MNRPPTPDVMENQGKEPTFQELINIEVCFFHLFFFFLTGSQRLFLSPLFAELA